MELQRKMQTDEELALQAGLGEDTAFSVLVGRLLPNIRRMAAGYSLPGLDQEDLVQEGLVGLMGAVRHYRTDRGAFLPYAMQCARNAMISAARTALDGSNSPLRDYSPLENETASVGSPHPQELLESAEFSAELRQWIESELTDLERRSLRLFLAGHTYTEIATLLSSHSKAVDNALQRVRRKLRRFYSIHSVST